MKYLPLMSLSLNGKHVALHFLQAVFILHIGVRIGDAYNTSYQTIRTPLFFDPLHGLILIIMKYIWESATWLTFKYSTYAFDKLIEFISISIGELRGLRAAFTEKESRFITVRELGTEVVDSFAIEGITNSIGVRGI